MLIYTQVKGEPLTLLSGQIHAMISQIRLGKRVPHSPPVNSSCQRREGTEYGPESPNTQITASLVGSGCPYRCPWSSNSIRSMHLLIMGVFWVLKQKRFAT